jgi:hypothetical protein
MDLSKISPLVTSHQTNKENYSHKWINRVTETKNQMFFKLITLPTHASWIFEKLIIFHEVHASSSSKSPL